MCTGPRSNRYPSQPKMERTLSQEVKTVFPHKTCSSLLELAAADDLTGFIHEIEVNGSDINEPSFWYCRASGSKKMGLYLRTPLMISSSYNSTRVLKYIIDSGKVDISRSCGSDGATPLHCASSAGSWPSDEEARSGPERREILLLPDINEGVYITDEFRMYSFKVRPCSRAYSHDWTECPFAHPGENARRRDPRRHGYTPVPCPEFKKGGCPKGDGCEYAHGVFESWLHPAQYRTRLCKDETGCSRRVCFFAHRPEELRPLYASTGSGLPSPSSGQVSPPISPSVTCSSPMARLTTPPPLHLSGSSRLRTAVSARDLELDFKPTSLESMFGGIGSPDASLMSHLQGLSPKISSGAHIRSSYPSSVRKAGSGYGFDSSAAVAAAVMGSRSAAFAKQRSQSFIDRAGSRGMSPGPVAPVISSGWGSPDGRLDWGFSGEEANKLRKSASFGIRSEPVAAAAAMPVGPLEADGPDVSWVNSLVKDVSLNAAAQWVEQMYMMEQEQMVA
ncbi:Zinc finger CCCH domain-containing protein 29 [Striga hermonthica]|uniref:Zinc finger CCCH domain-containing protein 29 n=1 Tax=Striga hermonthica TaxID=68872 RepID=A0A9N7RLF4_STRHE|nr:Zinc finger CCCH domain-containing protein 29 [Striga hermonthica]